MATQKRKLEWLAEFVGGFILPTEAGAGKSMVSNSEGKGEWKTKTRITSHSWTIQGEVKAETFPGFFVKLGTNEEQKLIGCRYELAEGTKAVLEIRRNGSGATGFTSLEAKSTEAQSTEPTAISLSSNDFIQIKITEVSGSPKGLTFTAWVEHT